MTRTELTEVESLLYRILPDPRGYAQRVVNQLIERVTLQTEELTPSTVPGVAGGIEMLMDRNLLLAAALGACECWGQDSKCETCFGAGSAGWVLPDQLLYKEYVGPATERLSEKKATGSTSRSGSPLKGDAE